MPTTFCGRHRPRHVTSSLPWQPAGAAGDLACVQLRSMPRILALRQHVDISYEAAVAGGLDDWCGTRSGHSAARRPDPECLGRFSRSRETSAVTSRHRRHCKIIKYNQLFDIMSLIHCSIKVKNYVYTAHIASACCTGYTVVAM